MSYGVRAVKTFTGREGKGFSASITRDDKVVGDVLDSANGGCFMIRMINREETALFEAEALRLYPNEKYERGDRLAGRLVAIDEAVKKCRKKTLFITATSDQGAFYQVNAPFTPEVKASILKQHPTAQFLNEDPSLGVY